MRFFPSKLRAAYWPIAIVLAWQLFYALSFVTIHFQRHTYEIASEWIYENVPPGSRILGVHWDDKLPQHLPGKSPHEFGYQYEGATWELRLYELPDDQPKFQEVARQLETADYIILPTPRLPGSIPRIPDEYPLSTNFFRLLYGGKLGFTLEATFKVRPGLFGIRFNDDLADESFYVYDHPKAVVFRRTETIPAEQLLQMIENPPQAEALPTIPELLLMDASFAGADRSDRSALGDVFLWLLVFEIIAFAVLPWFSTLFSGLPDRGYGLSKTAGLFTFGFVFWLLPSFQLAPASSNFASLCLLALSLLGYWVFAVKLSEAAREDLKQTVKDQWLPVEGLFIFGSLVFMVIRSLNPEIVWGEKPMDSTFLRYFARNESLPPQDPWAAGHLMNYYYVGIYFVASILKLTGIPASVGYNLAMATLAGLMLTGLYSTALALIRRPAWAVVAACCIVATSNYETINLWLFQKREANFDLFWATSRVFASPAFSEYPLWSLLFADLHAHVIAIPFGILLVGSLVTILLDAHSRFSLRGSALRVFAGLVLGALFGMNAWDFISLGILTVMALLASYHRSFWDPPRLADGSIAVREIVLVRGVSWIIGMGWDSLLIAAGALCTFLPFAVQSSSTAVVGWGWVQREEFNSLLQILRYCGHWIIISLLGLFLLASRRIFKREIEAVNVAGALVLATSPLVLAVISSSLGVGGIPWGIVFTGTLFLLLGGLAGFGSTKIEHRVYTLLACFVGFGMVAAELMFLIDRMNTIFKAYIPIGMCSAILAMLLLYRLLCAARAFGRGAAWVAGIVAFFVVGLPLLASTLNVRGIIRMQRVPVRSVTLDGTRYLRHSNNEDYRLIRWLNRSISGTPVMLEAQGDSYQDFTRISMHTGIPVVLGWEHHVSQRGLPHQKLSSRKEDVRRIYSSDNLEEAEQLLQAYGVDLIVVGTLEKRHYPSVGLEKFENNPDLFPVLYRADGVTVFTTRFSRLNPDYGKKL